MKKDSQTIFPTVPRGTMIKCAKCHQVSSIEMFTPPNGNRLKCPNCGDVPKTAAGLWKIAK